MFSNPGLPIKDSVSHKARRLCWWCLPVKASSSNKSCQSFSKAAKSKEINISVHRLAPVQLPSVNEAQCVPWDVRSRCGWFAHTLCQQNSKGLSGRCEAVYLCCHVDWWGGWGRGKGGMMWIVGELLWKEVFPPRRRLTEFDKAASAERRRGRLVAEIQETAAWMHV